MTLDLRGLAERVESAFEGEGLTVTMGGEPTFIVSNPDGHEWNQGAMGPEKLGYARRLARRLVEARYPGALVMQVFGKQYPEEPLPRWMVLTLSREDGVPLWPDPEKLLFDDVPGPHDDLAAERLLRTLGEALGFVAEVLPAFEEGRDTPRGWVLPLDAKEDGWTSDRWPFGHDNPLVLLPGKSPIGLRLPLHDLDEERLRRALTIEATEGALHVFLPPLDFDRFSALLESIARATEQHGLGELVFCGYAPTGESVGLARLGFSADPGVLEVNLPAVQRWTDYDGLLAAITRHAEAEGLRTTRHHLNGQIQGTGGGAHVLFGGPTLSRNPFFRRPDLLASMIRYWQWHPSLSYFFSGQYVGPGSQAPRADETVPDRLDELEIACAGVDALRGEMDRGMLDRLFRNLMTDSSGNTHRAEICLDKLWNLDSPTGLQGLVELRAFETMPDVGAQSRAALFARAVLAMLASEPRKGPLVRFGHRLHDRYMLPAVLWHDLGEICQDLARAGLPFDRAWLAPIFEHRFPVVGRLALESGDLLVRQALEPWPLMAEMSVGGATSRIVDNSTDRLELSADAQVLARAGIAVGGFALPLHEVDGKLIGGIRYKSAGGWPALHPHIPVQSPLAIEVFDSANRVVAAASYHFWNPEGPLYDGRPVDLAEARARREARWIELPDRRGAVCRPRPAVGRSDAYTVDLRRQ